MSHVYRKRGITSRLEWTPQSRTLIAISEAGSARFEGAVFVAASGASAPDSSSPVDPLELESLASRIEGCIPDPVRLERLVIAAGAAEHRLEGDGVARSWSDTNARCFASLALPDTPLQLEIDLGAASLEAIDLAPLQNAACAMRIYRGDMAPRGQFRLAPIVAAALWRALAALGARAAGARLLQSTHPDFRFDGNGEPIGPHFAEPWPNAYRPSYRGAAVAMPFHLDIESTRIDAFESPAVVALAEPLRLAGDELILTGLFADGGASFRTVVKLSPDAWLRSIQGVGRGATWFPFEAGSWGRDVKIAPTKA